jgi:hypothetical protein
MVVTPDGANISQRMFVKVLAQALNHVVDEDDEKNDSGKEIGG